MYIYEDIKPSEPWRPVKGFEDKYFVSPDGRIFSLYSRRLINPGLNNVGYLATTLSDNYRTKIKSVHRMVAEAFLEKPNDHDYFEVRHLDGNPLNNHVDNLAWGTQAQNQADKERHGRVPRGSRHGSSKLNEDLVLDIRDQLSRGESLTALAKQFNVSKGTIGFIRDGATWKHILPNHRT